jgi:hypothetical protein
MEIKEKINFPQSLSSPLQERVMEQDASYYSNFYLNKKI